MCRGSRCWLFKLRGASSIVPVSAFLFLFEGSFAYPNPKS